MSRPPIIFRALIVLTALAAAFVIGRKTVPVRTDLAASVPQVAVIENQKSEMEPSPAKQTPADATLNKDEQTLTMLKSLAANLKSEASFDKLLQQLMLLAASNPSGALNFIEENLSPPHKAQMQAAILAVWAKQDPQSAWTWAMTNATSQNIDAVLNQTGKSDPETAWHFASDFAKVHPEEAQAAYVSALRGMLYAGNYAAAAHLAELSTSSDTQDFRPELNSLIAGAWARYDPEKAAEWALQLPENSRGQALTSLGQAWAENDPAKAAELVINLPSGNIRQQVATQILPVWVGQNAAAAATWLNQFQPSPDFDQAINAIAIAPGVMEFPSTAAAWANAIYDPELRAQTLTGIMESWLNQDRTAAQNYLQTSTELTSDTRAAVESRLAGKLAK